MLAPYHSRGLSSTQCECLAALRIHYNRNSRPRNTASLLSTGDNIRTSPTTGGSHMYNSSTHNVQAAAINAKRTAYHNNSLGRRWRRLLVARGRRATCSQSEVTASRPAGRPAVTGILASARRAPPRREPVRSARAAARAGGSPQTAPARRQTENSLPQPSLPTGFRVANR